MSISLRLAAIASVAVSPALADELTAAFLLGEQPLEGPVHLREFTPPADAAAPAHRFRGSLKLLAPERAGRFRLVHDDWNRHGEFGRAVRTLPPFEFDFVQRGRDLLPLQRGVIRRDHRYWEIVLQPGRVWQQADDGPWTRAALPFALQERVANCTHNGMLTWLFNDSGAVSRVAYQIGSETCGYFKFDAWGAVRAEYRLADYGEAAVEAVERLDRHRAARLPVKPLAALWEDYPALERRQFGIDDGIEPGDITVLGLVVDGVHYRSDCPTRYGSHPFCESLPLPSYSTAKSIFAGIATMRLERLHPGLTARSIADLVGPCRRSRWGDVTIEHALDMASGNFRSRVHEEDEHSIPHWRFLFRDDHRGRLRFACRHFPREAEPGSTFVYHSSDTYLVGTALANVVANEDEDADLYRDVLVGPIWRPLELSPLLDDSKRSYDSAAQPFTGYGLTYEADDIVRIAQWLADSDGEIDGEPMLDPDLLAASLQRSDEDRGIDTGLDNLRYNNGFWAFDASEMLDCAAPVRIPFMSGVSGITVAMFPNGVIYYYFSDGYVFRWGSAIRAAHEFRSLCT